MGVEKQRQAMAGPGGRTAVKLRIAEGLTDKPILIVPSSSGTSLQTLDINRIYGSIRTQEGAHGSSASAKTAHE